MKTEISTYEQQAIDFLKKHGIEFSATFEEIGHHFNDDEKNGTRRAIFTCVFERIEGSDYFDITFGQSIANGNAKPTAYDVLACLTKSDPGDFEDFCSEFGYNEDSRSAYETWQSVVKEWDKVNDFFTAEEIEELQEIQ